MIKEGRHEAKAVECAFGKTKGGDPQIAIGFELVETREAITYYGYFSEKAQKFAFDAMRACGWTSQRPSDAPYQIMAAQSPVELVVRHEVYEGEARAKVRFVNRPGEGGLRLARPMDKGELAAFDAAMQGAAIAHGQSGGGGNGSKNELPPEAMRQPGDDDFPY